MRDDDVGWPYVGGSGVFHDKGWGWVGSTWRDRYVTGSAGWVAEYRHMVEIVDSVLSSGVSDRLLVSTSMHDLLIHPAGDEAGEYQTILVVSPANYPLLRGHMGLAFFNGRRREYRQYLVEDAVEAFWDVVGEKYGIRR
ncbi:hypothetical protein SK803_30055 [Lentzea sp. BCCO 10_0856]|uniref:Uncharacterized protein n=1 Tax=Lentzea miocenica TaxID=3095431 RepID=A0ABU4T8I9_9PSEU|nr:hypothetical protein [Lentzea sp. BCCO 10_0856]MDX8034483.1 hypothetical protein [Lentzea sp. BCCO 10_0856]